MKRQADAPLTLSVDAFGGESVNREIGCRMKTARTALGLTQPAFAEAIGGSKPGLQDNEAGKTMPGGRVLYGFVRAGINANWLLTGEGPMLLAHQAEELQEWKNRAAQLQAQCDELAESLRKALEEAWARAPTPQINEDAFAAILGGIMQALPGAPAERIAKLSVEFYLKTLNEGLITPEGVGEGGSKAA